MYIIRLVDSDSNKTVDVFLKQTYQENSQSLYKP